MRVPILAVVIVPLLALGLGYLLRGMIESPAIRPDQTTRTPVLREGKSSGEKPQSSEGKTSRSDGDSSAPDLDAARVAASDREAQLRKELDEVRAKLVNFEDGMRAQRGVLISRVSAAIQALKGAGLQAFTSPGATSDLIANLKALGDEGVQIALGLLDSANENERFLGAKLLEDLADPASVDGLLRTALGDPVELVANMASHAVALLDDPKVVDPLHRIVQDAKHEGARVNALFGLCKQGDRKGIDLALEYVRNENHSAGLRMALGAGVLILSDARVMPIADEVVKQGKGSGQVMKLAVEYYRSVNTSEARARLQAIAQDTTLTQEVRDAALEALRG